MSEPRWVRIGTLADPPAAQAPIPAERVPADVGPAHEPRPAAADLGAPPPPEEDARLADGDLVEETASDGQEAGTAWAVLESLPPPPDLDVEEQLLQRWREERRPVTVVLAGGPAFSAQIVGAGRHALYVADASGQARLIYRWAIRELIPAEA